MHKKGGKEFCYSLLPVMERECNKGKNSLYEMDHVSMRQHMWWRYESIQYSNDFNRE